MASKFKNVIYPKLKSYKYKVKQCHIQLSAKPIRFLMAVTSFHVLLSSLLAQKFYFLIFSNSLFVGIFSYRYEKGRTVGGR